MQQELKERQWSVLEPGVVENVLYFVKKSLHWKREATRLRLLNKHWCREVDRHVHSIQPHHSRKIVANDLLSLLKFSRASLLDASRFVQAYEADNLPSIPVLSRLQHLHSLRVATKDWNTIDVSAFGQLCGLTSLTLETSVMAVVSERDLRILSRLPLQKLSIQCPIQRMGPFFQRNRSLTNLTAQVLPSDFGYPFNIALLNGLVSLKLSVRPGNLSFNLPDLAPLGAVTTLEHVDLLSLCNRDLDWLVHLPALKSLKISTASINTLSSVTFLHVIQRLTTFHARCILSQTINIGPMIQRAEKLEELSTKGFSISCHHIRETIRSVKRLSLQNCTLLQSPHFLSDLASVQELGFQGMVDPFSHLRLADTNLQQLTVLKVRLLEVDSIPIICRLTHLHTLGLRIPYPLSIHALTQLGKLPHVITFGLSPPFPESTMGVFINSDMALCLESLYLSDEHRTLNTVSLQLLKESMQQLKIETEPVLFDSFMEAI